MFHSNYLPYSALVCASLPRYFIYGLCMFRTCVPTLITLQFSIYPQTYTKTSNIHTTQYENFINKTFRNDECHYPIDKEKLLFAFIIFAFCVMRMLLECFLSVYLLNKTRP